MIGALSLCGVSAVACGYQVYRQTRGTGSKNRESQIARFREVYSLPEPVLTITTALRDIIADRVPLPKEPVVSFDLFDTLVGRDVANPEVIFELVEARSGIAGFADARKRAGNLFCSPECLGSIHDIYNHLSNNASIMSQPGINLDRLREMEWQMELEHTVLIESNVEKILTTSPDRTIIIVSDTFYTASKLRELLIHLKFPRLDEITIFASRSGKEDGWVWPILNEYYTIASHTGDNKNTDVNSALKSKVIQKVIHSSMAHSPTSAEALLFSLGGDVGAPERQLGSLVRRLSLGNPYTFEKSREKFFWYRLHASYTVPLFWYFTQSIREILDANPEIIRIAAISRDCILLETMIRKFLLGGQGVFTSKSGVTRTVTLNRLDSSRRLLVDQLKNPNEDYLNYLREVLGADMKETLVLDINGTYRSLSDITKKHFGSVPRAHFLTIQNGSILPQVRGLLTVAIPEIDTNVLEKMNITRCGSLIDWIGSRTDAFGGPIRTPCEYSEDMIEVSYRMILQDGMRVLEDHAPKSLPRSRVMASLLENATITVGGQLQHTNQQVTLPSLIHKTRESSSRTEIALHLSRIFTLYHDSSVRILDLSDLKMPWTDFLKSRVQLVKPEEEVDVTIVATSSQELQATIDRHKSLLIVHLSSHVESLDESRLLANWSLKSGSTLLVFKENRKAQPVDIESELAKARDIESELANVDDLPEVPADLPSHSHMIA